jgi:hypothetical protein
MLMFFLGNVITLVDFTGIHTAVTAQALAHIDAGPPDTVGTKLHG